MNAPGRPPRKVAYAAVRTFKFHNLKICAKISWPPPRDAQKKMKSLLLTKYNHLEITDTPKPDPSPDEVLIQVAACGICGSDVHGFDGSTGRRIPPLVMGHEA